VGTGIRIPGEGAVGYGRRAGVSGECRSETIGGWERALCAG
jgi:hypothetical protein